MRQQQEARAKQIQQEWAELGRAPSYSAGKRRFTPGQTVKRPAATPPPPPQEDIDDLSFDPDQHRLPPQALLEKVAKKRMKNRDMLRGVNMLRREGLIELGDLRVSTKGSHNVIHGPGGCATIVRQHKGSKPPSRKMFIKTLQRVATISRPAPSAP